MKTEGIKTWQDRAYEDPTLIEEDAKADEIRELRAALKERDAEIEQLRVQLAGCGVAAMQNTESSKAGRAKREDYGWSNSYDDVCRMVDREIAQRAVMQQALDAAADGDYMLDSSDCIKVLRGTWGGNYLNDHPVLPAVGAAPVPDMIWNSDDAETLYSSIDEFLNDEICNGSLEVGDIRTVQQAKRLPDTNIKITAIDDTNCEAEWEALAAAPKEQP